jgi:signal peptidase I
MGMFASAPLLSLRLAEWPAISIEPVAEPPAPRALTSTDTPWRRARKMLLRALIIALLVRTFIGETSVVPTPSMEGTILVGDHLFWSKALYGPEIPLIGWRLPRLRNVRRGDIVAFRLPTDREQMYLKRVAAVGGDMVEIRSGALYVNGTPVEENYAVHRGGPSWSHSWEQMPAVLVPAGKIFVLGDNRDNSSDSRDWGPVPEDNVVGSPWFVFWSYDAPSAAWLEQRTSERLEFYTSVAAHFFSRTRWSRMGRVL